MPTRRSFIALSSAAVGVNAVRSQAPEVQEGETVIPVHGPMCPNCYPVLQPPEYMDLFDDSDPEMAKLLQEAMDFLVSFRRGELYGVILPSGWTLTILGSEVHRTDTAGKLSG